MELGLLGVLLSNPERPTKDNNPVLWRVLNNLGYGSGYMDEMSKEEIQKRALNVIEGLSNAFAYYDASELKVNEVLDRYLVKLHADWYDNFREDSRQIAITVCALGNKVADADETAGVNLWIEEGNNVLATLIEYFEAGTECDAPQHKLNHFAYVEKILEIVDVFVTTHRGMLAGVEEYAPQDYQDIYPLYPVDFVSGNECGGDEDCGCGCKLEHPLLMLEGVEDLMSGNDTAAAKYAAGVFFANDIKLMGYQGNEEGALDTIKEMGVAAYEWVRDALKSFMELFSPEKAEEESKAAETVAENNKKAIQAMPNKGVRINDAAKAGIAALAKQTDASGAMSKVVAGLNTAGDASRVIDGLQALLNKNIGKSGKLSEKLTKAQTSLNELKAATDKAGATKPDNKEVVSNTRTNVKDKITKAKASVKEVKDALSAQNKITKGIQKAIKGISPKIFTKEGDGNTADAKPTAKPTEKAPAKGKKE